MSPQAQSIDEVIAILQDIIQESLKEKSTKGYFAVLYLKVTQKVKEGIANGVFEDGPRMEKLDVIFANRYIEAYYLYQNNQPTSKSWEIAFEQSNNYWLIVLQHLLLGMNAHINLDLGVAAAQVCPKDAIVGLQNDFNTINTILSSLVADVEQDLSEIWPILKWILNKTKGIDTFLIDFSMKQAREGAWKFALLLAPLEGVFFEQAIAKRDLSITLIAQYVYKLPWFPTLVFKFFRLFELGTVDQKIMKLQD